MLTFVAKFVAFQMAPEVLKVRRSIFGMEVFGKSSEILGSRLDVLGNPIQDENLTRLTQKRLQVFCVADEVRMRLVHKQTNKFFRLISIHFLTESS